MEEKKKNEKECEKFHQNKIISLNKFFMKNVGIGTLLLILIYVLSFGFLFVLVNNSNVDQGLRISLLSMIATFTLTTSKSVIEKIIAIIQYVISLLAAEQRGISKTMGIEVEKVEFENLDEEEQNNDIPID